MKYTSVMRQLIMSFCVVLCLYNLANAQTKTLDSTQYFKNNFSDLLTPPVYFKEWQQNDSGFIYTKGTTKYSYNVYTQTKKTIEEVSNPIKKIMDTTAKLLNNNIIIQIGEKEIQLTTDSIEKQNITLSPNKQWIAYTQKNNLFSIHIPTQKKYQLTFDGNDSLLNGYASWVYMEEILGRASHYKAFWWSPNSEKICYFKTSGANVPIITLTDGMGKNGYVEKWRYPKAGEINPTVKLMVINNNGTGEIACKFTRQNEDGYMGLPYWHPSSEFLLLQWINREQNYLSIYKVISQTGLSVPYIEEKQKTFIQLDDEGRRITWLQNGKTFIYQSDASGFNHLYLYNGITGKLINNITQGSFTVLNISGIDEAKNKLIFTARGKENTARKDIYSIDFSGKNLERISKGNYNNTFISIDPKNKFIVWQADNTTTPTEYFYTTLAKPNAIIFDSIKNKNFNKYILAKTEIIRQLSDDSLFSLPLKITWPLNMQKNKVYPVLISIYGGPNAGTVWDSWILSGTQQFYASEGLIQVTMDHRGSGQFGKAGVNYMYKNLGFWEMKDYTTLVRWLINNAQADSSRICITGFSYGGYLSCYAMTYGYKTFTHAMAGGSVTDWQLYDSHYTERYMNTPQNNIDGYKNSSVLNYAKNYSGRLQLVHGVIDENVHMQNSTQLLSLLQDQKKDIEWMSYSGSRHGWGGNKGLHYQNLKTKFIYKHLLQKEVPPQMLK